MDLRANGLARGQDGAPRQASVAVPVHDPVPHVANPQAARLAAEALQRRVRVDPGVVRRMYGQGHVVGAQRGEAGAKLVAVEAFRAYPACRLKVKVLLHPAVIAAVGDEQIALAPEADPGGLAVDRHLGFEVAEEPEAVAGHGDVLGQAEQLADAAVAPRRRGELVGRIGFDDDDLAASPLATPAARQVIGDAGADDPAADDEDVTTHGSIQCDRKTRSGSC